MWEVYRHDGDRGYPVIAVVESQAEAIEIAKAYTEEGDSTEYTCRPLSDEEARRAIALIALL